MPCPFNLQFLNHPQTTHASKCGITFKWYCDGLSSAPVLSTKKTLNFNTHYTCVRCLNVTAFYAWILISSMYHHCFKVHDTFVDNLVIHRNVIGFCVCRKVKQDTDSTYKQEYTIKERVSNSSMGHQK